MRERGLTLVHVDDALVVLDKPAGLLAVPGRGPEKQDCAAARVQARYPDARVVHRLDMATSGLMVMARGAAAQRVLSRAFAAREVMKRYVAVVGGCPAAPRGRATAEWATIDLPLRADWPNRPRQIVDREGGKPSLTRWRMLECATGATRARVELEPITGRSHQLRVHLCALGHPILGDALYAPPELQAMAGRLMLHASALRFAHPATGARLTFVQPAPF